MILNRKIFFLLGIFSSGVVFSLNYTNKNFLMPKPAGKDLYMDVSSWYELKRDAENGINSKYGGAFQVVGFFKSSTRKNELGAYFGVQGKNVIKYGHGAKSNNDLETEDLLHNALKDKFSFQFAGDKTYHAPRLEGSFRGGNVTPNIVDGTTNTAQDEQTMLLIAKKEYRRVQAISEALDGELALRPRRREFGCKLSYFGCPDKKVYFKIDVPIVQVEHDFRLTLEGAEKQARKNDNAEISLIDLISGTYEHGIEKDQGNKDAQAALRYAIIPTDKITKRGLGDIDFYGGYKVVDEEKYDCNVYAKVTLPVAEASSGKYLFEPILGNGRHLEFGLGLEGSADLYHYAGFSLELVFNGNVTYALEKEETRTFGSYLDLGARLPWQKYMLVGQNGKSGVLNPLANVTTMSAKVRPGFRGEAVVLLGLSSKNYFADIGCSFFAKEGEKIEFKEWLGDGQYGFADPILYRTDMEFDPSLDGIVNLGDPDSSGAPSIETVITKAKLDPETAATPAGMVSSLFASVSYRYSRQMPFLISVGGSYDFSRDNVVINGFGVWGKLAISF
jgi:hypothetical protein